MSRIKKKGESIQRKLEGETEKQNDINKEYVMPLYSFALPETGCLAPGDEIPITPSMGPYTLEINMPESQNTILPEKQNVEKTEKQNSGKEKVTFYLSREIMAKFNEVCAKRMMRNEKMNRSELICKAIDLLWKEEKTYEI